MSSKNSRDDLPPVSKSNLPDVSSAGPAKKKRAPKEPAEEPLPKRIGSYRILAVLGQGGMGRVYRAVQDNPARQVALKVIRPGTTSPERLRRFEHEAKVLARLQHPGIAQIFEADIADAGQGPQPFFAMELIDGVTLTTFVEEKSRAAPAVLRLFTQVCHAIQHAHQRGIIHRDLKPDNILVDQAGRPKLIDFGVARLADREIVATKQGTQVGQIVGTLRYMSPEQIQAEPDEVDTRSDVYSLGVICYELLSGKAPYKLKGLPLPRVVQVITEAEPTPLSSVNRVFRGDLDTIVLKAMEKDKNRRYQTAGDFAADIERYLTDQPIQARPASALYQMRKFARRNQALVGGIVATLFALVLGLIGTTWWAMAARQSEFRTIEKTAQLAMQRGVWQDALKYIDQALATNAGKDSISLRLDRIRALFALNDTPAAVRELEALASRTDLAGQEGTVLLMKADILQGNDIPATLASIQRARAKGLSAAEDAYAQALCAASTPEAVNALRKSLELNPYQPRAQGMLSLLLLLLGQREETRLQMRTYAALFPEDLNLKLMQALLTASEGKGKDAEAQLASLDALLNPATQTELKIVLGAMAEASDAKNWASMSGIPDIQRRLKAVEVVNVQHWRTAREHPTDGQVLLPLPPVLRQAYGRLLEAIESYDTKNTKVVIAELEAIQRIHPEGTIRYVLALMYFADGHLIEAEREGLAAADEPSLYPVHRQALWVAGTAEGFLGTPRRPKPDLQKRQKAAETLKRAFAMLPTQPHEREIAAKILLYAGETNLASGILDDWKLSEPDTKMIPWLRARVKLREGAYLPAIEEAQKVLAVNPGDSETQTVLKEATEKLLKDASKVRQP